MELLYSFFNILWLQIVIPMPIVLDIRIPAYQTSVIVDRIQNAREEKTALGKQTSAKTARANVARITNAPDTMFAFLENVKVHAC